MNISEDIGTRLLYENDRVRVWDLALAPGESTGMHRHENDYLYVVIGGGTLQGVSSEGDQTRGPRYGGWAGAMARCRWRRCSRGYQCGGWSLAEYYCGVKGIKKAGTQSCPLFLSLPVGEEVVNDGWVGEG